jgi:dihydroneopterin triphosphate diphosphatase
VNDNARIAVRVVDVYPYRIRCRSSNILLLRRAPGRSYAGSVADGRGKDPRKSKLPRQAALREFQEETGLHPIAAWALPSPNIFYDWEADRINIAPAFAVEAAGEPVLNDEHEASEWHPVERAIERLGIPSSDVSFETLEHTAESRDSRRIRVDHKVG